MIMRQIKFRAFDNKNKKMVYGVSVFDSCAFKNNIHLPVLNGEVNYFINQFTGLLDKNELELYENDIIQLGDTEGNKLIKKAWYCDKNCSLMIGNLRYSQLMESGFFQPSDLEFEIIGNIHENPELLNQPI